MPHELIAGLEAAAAGVLVLLLVPKRGVNHIRERFADLSSGRRRWLFEPPAWQRAKRPEGARMAVLAAIDVFELGVPLFVAARLAEQRSAQIYLDRQSRWADTPKALLAAHLKGGMTDAELHSQLVSRGLPQPSAKAVFKKVEARPLISVKWWLERQALAEAAVKSNGAHDGERAVRNAEEAEEEPEELDEAELSRGADTNPSHLTIRTLGRLQLLQAGQDYGPMLMSKKVLAFIWLYLLVRRLLEPAGWVQRSAFAEEFSPGLSVKRQSKRMRDRVGDILRRDLPEVLASRLTVDRQAMRLDLSNCSIDVVRLQEVARQCADQKGMLTTDLVAEARRMLDETEGEFLPGWEEIEAEANGGQGAAKEYVRALREVAETARVDLMGALAANHLARQEPRKAISLLENALEHQPDREDLARKLRAAYLETGQHARAAELQKEHALDT